MRTALYRHFDAAGVLLYVGISLNSIKRTMQHKQGARWFERIARIQIEWLDSRPAALAAEAIAIARERPTFNVQRPKANTRARLPKTVAEILHPASGRVDGWYLDGSGEHMFGWWSALYPGEKFILLKSEEIPYPLPDCLCLRSSQSEKWARSKPDYKAADRFDAIARGEV